MEQLALNLLSVNLLYIRCNVTLARRHISLNDFPGITNLASSAYKTDLILQSKNRSLITYTLKTTTVLKPWVTPCIINRG